MESILSTPFLPASPMLKPAGYNRLGSPFHPDSQRDLRRNTEVPFVNLDASVSRVLEETGQRPENADEGCLDAASYHHDLDLYNSFMAISYPISDHIACFC